MQKPRKLKRYCPTCKTHTVHDVDKVKKRRASELKQGQRRFRRVMRGYGGFPRPKPEGREKTSRRVNLRYNCSKCHKIHQPPSLRSKKFELGE